MFLQGKVYTYNLPLLDLAFLKFASGSGTAVTGSGTNHSGSTTLNYDKKKKILFQRKKKHFTKAVFVGIPP
jgi:hypothetical protein